MARVVRFVNNVRVIEDTDDPDLLVPERSIEDIVEEVASRFIDQDMRTKALAAVMADLAVAAGVAPDVSTARQLVRARFKQYYQGFMEE